jgi:hypothetical protein
MNIPVRTITDHIINPANDRLTITVTDAPGAGGANHRYEVHGYNAITNPGHQPAIQCDNETVILFQNGPIAEKGTNGVTHEVMLAIVADRLRSFQSGPYACRENALALTKIEEAMHWLQQRTLARIRRDDQHGAEAAEPASRPAPTRPAAASTDDDNMPPF